MFQKKKRVWSPEARKRISEAQKKRWEKTKVEVTVPPMRRRSYIEAFKFLHERTNIYSSTVDAYVDGFIDGYSEAKS